MLPNHIRKFINPTNERVPVTEPMKSMGSLMMFMFISMLLIGPELENMVKNSMANAEAMIRFGR